METKSIHNILDTQENGQLKGYASIFNIKDADGDIILPGAFDNTQIETCDIQLLLYHDFHKQIGKITLIQEDERGLYIECKLNLGTHYGKMAYDLVKGGVIDGLSIGFDIIKYKKEGALRYIEELRLVEISIVSLPSNPKAKIFYVKSASGVEKVNDIMHDLKAIITQSMPL